MKHYAQLLALKPARNLLLSGLIARLGQGVLILAWLTLWESTLGSYGIAGGIAVCTTLGMAISGPVLGRLSDTHGARWVLIGTAATYCLAQSFLLAATLTGKPVSILVLLSFLSGLSQPQVSAVIRAAWLRLTDPSVLSN